MLLFLFFFSTSLHHDSQLHFQPCIPICSESSLCLDTTCKFVNLVRILSGKNNIEGSNTLYTSLHSYLFEDLTNFCKTFLESWVKVTCHASYVVQNKIMETSMAESFVNVCSMLLKFHNLSEKLT